VGKKLVDVLQFDCGFGSRKQGRKLVADGALSLNGKRVDDAERRINAADLWDGKALLFRSNKRVAVVAVSDEESPSPSG
jgi:ribosomal protein S4